MSKPLTNYDIAQRQFKDSFKEQLKQCIYNGAVVMDVDEMAAAVKEVSEEVLSFLRSEAKSISGEKKEN